MTEGTSATEWEGEYLLRTLTPRRDHRPVQATYAEGCWVHLADGRRMLDLHGQHLCMGVGHRHPKLVAALHRALDTLDYVAADLLTENARSTAAKLLVEETMAESLWAGGVRFVSSGSEATEMALLIARLYTGRPTVVTRDAAYHGWTAAAAAASGVSSLRNGFRPAGEPRFRAVPTPHAPYPVAPSPICSNCPLGQSYPQCKDADGRLACVRETERVIRSVGVNQVAAFITEIWHGAGAFLAPDEYAPQVREMTRRLGLLWIDDEAIGGPARTGRWWAFQHGGVDPDIATMAKGLSSSAVPVGACVVSRDIKQFFDNGSWAHGSTFAGHPLAMAAVAANLQIIAEEDLVARAAELGAYLASRLTELAAAHPSVSSVSGRGLVWGLELVKDPVTGDRWVPADRWPTATDPPAELLPSLFVTWQCHARNVLLSTYAPNTVTLGPPLTISTDELDLGLQAVDEALSELDDRMED
jgi:taurine--2-oxoglutarate transaminase